jgi:hypothetical protein
VSHPKTINIKQYLSTDNFSVNNRNGCNQIFTNNTTFKMKKIDYQTRRVAPSFNCEIGLNQKMLILKRFVTTNDVLCEDVN